MHHQRTTASLLKSALLGAATLGALSLAGVGVAQAGASYSYNSGGIALTFGTSARPFITEDLNPYYASGSPAASSPISLGDGTTITFSGQSGVVEGTTGTYKSPYNDSTTAYLVAQAGQPAVTLSYAAPQASFDILWGTVDANKTGYNNLALNVGSKTVTGQFIKAAFAAKSLAFTTGVTSIWAEISLTNGATFTQVTATDTTSSPAFEFAPGRATNPASVPEPGSLALLGTGLLGLGVVIRRRRRKA